MQCSPSVPLDEGEPTTMGRGREKSDLEDTLVPGAWDRFVIHQLLAQELLQQEVLGQTYQHFHQFQGSFQLLSSCFFKHR